MRSGRAGDGRQSRARLLLHRAVPGFPSALVRVGAYESPGERLQSTRLATREFELSEGLFMLERMDKLDLAVLANANARLRSLDHSAAGTLPGFHVVIH